MIKNAYRLFFYARPTFMESLCDWLFYLIILLIPFERAFKAEKFAFLQYFVVLFVFVALFRFAKYYSKFNIAIIFYFVFLFWGSIADIRTTGWLGLLSLWYMLRSWVVWFLMLFAYNMSLQSSIKVKRLILCIILMACLVALLRTFGIGVDDSHERMEVMGANVNATARILVLVVVYTLLLLSNGIKASMIYRVTFGIISLMAMFAMIKTASRGGALALALGMSGLVFTSRKVSRKIIYLIMAGIALAGFIYLVISNDVLMERFFHAYYDDDTGGRKGFIEMSWYLLSYSKLFGYGCIAHTFELGQAFGIEIRATHNTYMYALMAAGYPGALFYYLSLAIIAWSAWKIKEVPYGNFLFLVCLMMFFSGYVMNIEGTKWLYVVYGVTLGLSDRIKYARQLHLPDSEWVYNKEV